MKLNNMDIPKVVIISLLGLVFGVFYIVFSAKHLSEITPVREPAKKDFSSAIAGVGIIEALDQNVHIFPSRNGKVEKIYVKEGDIVQKNQPLFKLDTDELDAELQSEMSEANAQNTELQRLQHLPRPEDIPPLQANLNDAQASYSDKQVYYQRMKNLYNKKTVSENDYIQSMYNFEKAKANLEKAQADLKKLEAGAWQYEIKAAEDKYKSSYSRA